MALLVQSYWYLSANTVPLLVIWSNSVTTNTVVLLHSLRYRATSVGSRYRATHTELLIVIWSYWHWFTYMDQLIRSYQYGGNNPDILRWKDYERATDMEPRRRKFRGTDTKLLLRSHLCEATTTEVLEKSYWATNTQTYKMELLIEE